MIVKYFEKLFYSIIASAVLAWVTIHPQFHDVAMLILGVIAHAMGVQTGVATVNGNGNGVATNGNGTH